MLENAVAAGIENAELYKHLGGNYFELGDESTADKHYRHALRLDPDHLGARVNYGWLLYHRGKYAAAIRHYRHVLARAPNSAAQFNLGLALLAEGRTDSAQAVYAAGIKHYGVEEAERIGADDDLLSLAETGAEAALAIHLRYWP